MEFFFQSQRAIFDDAWKLQEQFHREIVYFADEPEALAAAETAFGNSEKPQALPGHREAAHPEADHHSAAYDRINAARREQVQ